MSEREPPQQPDFQTQMPSSLVLVRKVLLQDQLGTGLPGNGLLNFRATFTSSDGLSIPHPQIS